jgi:hypothetical protein
MATDLEKPGVQFPLLFSDESFMNYKKCFRENSTVKKGTILNLAHKVRPKLNGKIDSW